MVLEKPKSSNEKIQRHLGSAGAITTLNAEGKLKTIKVKTERYVSGKKPDYVDENFDSEAENSSEQNSDDQEFTKLDAKISLNDNDLAKPAEILNTVEISAHDQHRLAQRHPQMSTSSAIHSTGHESAAKTFEMNNDAVEVTKTINKVVVEQPQNLSRAELSRQLLQQHDENLKNQQFKSKESTVKPHTGSHRQRAHSSSDSGSDSDDDDDEDDYTDSDEEHVRLKPVFVPKNERLTIQQKKEAEQQLLLSKQMAKEAAKQNKNRILNIIDKELRREEAAAGKTSDPSLLDLELMADELDTDDEPDDEMEYKKWSVRELERIKADKAERERIRSEKEELQMIHEMSDEKRLAFMLKNPKKNNKQSSKRQIQLPSKILSPWSLLFGQRRRRTQEKYRYGD